MTKEEIVNFYAMLLADLDRAQSYSDIRQVIEVIRKLLEFDLKVVEEAM